VLQKRFGTNYDSVSRSYSRRRVSTDVEILSLEGDLANDQDPNVDIRRYARTLSSLLPPLFPALSSPFCGRNYLLLLITLFILQVPVVRRTEEDLHQSAVRRGVQRGELPEHRRDREDQQIRAYHTHAF
jgi:hypothetical protein